MRTAFLFALILVIAALGRSADGVSAQQAGRWDRVLDLPSGAVHTATFADEHTVWAAGYGGIFRSGDSGRSWRTARTTHAYLTDIEAAPGGTRGWAVGVLGQMLVTDDGGATWTDGDPATELNLSQVEALDERTLLASGAGLGQSDDLSPPLPFTFRRSGDGGVTWSEIPLEGDRVTAIAAIDDGAHAWAMGEGCEQEPPPAGYCRSYVQTLFRSTDGGVGWSAIATGHRLSEMQFVSAETGWAVEFTCADAPDYTTCRPIVSRTDDGGATWTALLALPHDAPAALWAASESAATVASQSCTQSCTTQLQRTTDGGATWAPVGAALAGYASDLAFNDAGAGVVTLGEALHWTDDGGRTLHLAELPITAGGGDFDFIDARSGWFAASKLLRTTDGGATFAPVSDFRPDRIDFVSENVGWATDLICDPSCGNRVEILKTRDGGRTWEFQYAHELGDYLELAMFDEQRGFAYVPSDQLLLRTADGGATWTELPLPGGVTLDFIDANIVWAGEVACYQACEVRVWRSSDGGSSWARVSPLPFASEGCPLQLEALDATHAWATTYRCAQSQMPLLFRTQDGGASWQQSDVGGTGQVRELAFFDRLIGRGLRAVCPGVSGYCDTVIMRTSDGGGTWTHEPLPEDLSISVSSWFAEDQFVGPEQIWVRVTHGGGILAVSGQELWRYAGSRPIVAPNTGSAEASGEVPPALFALMLVAGSLCFAAAAVAGVRRTLGR